MHTLYGDHLRDKLSYLEQGREIPTAVTRAQTIFFGTRSLDEVYRENLQVLALQRKHGDRELIENQLFMLHTLNLWRGAQHKLDEERDPEIARFDVAAYAQKLAKPANIVQRGFFAVLRQAQLYFEGDYLGSLRVGLAFKQQAFDLLGITVEHMHRFFFMLAYLAADREKLGWGERMLSAGYYRLNRLLLSAFDLNAPDFCSHLHLIRAEEQRKGGCTLAALKSYEEATLAARGASGFLEALANQRLAGFLHDQGLALQAHLVARQAFLTYRSLGFRSELSRLTRDFPELSGACGTRPEAMGSRTSSDLSSSTTVFAERLEVESLARGALAISSEVRLDGLIEALLRQLCRSSAAQRVVLLLQQDEALLIQGEIVVSGDATELTVLQNVPFPEKRGRPITLAESLVEVVARTKRTELLGDAAHEGDYVHDRYVQEHKVKSLLGMPILNQGKLLGVLYLENPAVAHAFTATHQAVLEVLSSQAAISFENARLYRSLEQKVEQRTTELRRKTADLESMLQNLEQGVFTILRDGTIHPEYSRQLETILGTRAIAGREYTEVLFEGTDLSADLLSQMKAAISFSVGSQLLWYESNRHLLVRELQRKRPDGTVSTLEINWSPILSDGKLVEKLLVSIKDVSELRNLERQTREQRCDLEMIGQILALPRNTFLDFMHDTDALLERNHNQLRQGVLDAEAVASLFAVMHTVKGNAHTYGFDSLASAAHDAEETFSRFGLAPEPIGDRERMQRDLAAVRASLQRYRQVYARNLESFAAGGGRSTPVDDALLEQLRSAVRRSRSEELTATADAVGTSTLDEIVAAAAIGARELASKLDKPMPNVRARSGKVRFRQEIVAMLRDVFAHLLRNALDHGIESPPERGERGKPDAGEVLFMARPSAEGCEILVRDDGRGLPVGKLRALASRSGLCAESDEALTALVFRCGISTSEAVTDISGRGVGMDAIHRFVSERGGQVQLELGPANDTQHRPFAIRIVLPARYIVALSFHQGLGHSPNMWTGKTCSQSRTSGG